MTRLRRRHEESFCSESCLERKVYRQISWHKKCPLHFKLKSREKEREITSRVDEKGRRSGSHHEYHSLLLFHLLLAEEQTHEQEKKETCYKFFLSICYLRNVKERSLIRWANQSCCSSVLPVVGFDARFQEIEKNNRESSLLTLLAWDAWVFLLSFSSWFLTWGNKK